MKLGSWAGDLRRMRYPGRFMLALGVLLLLLCVLVGRLIYLQVPQFNDGFLQEEGDKRNLRRQSIPAHRGLITDRNGEPLAVSTPMVRLTVSPLHLLCWMHDPKCARKSLLDKLDPEDPKDAAHLQERRQRWVAVRNQLAEWYAVTPAELQARLEEFAGRQYLFLLRERLTPDRAAFLRQEYRLPGLGFEEVYQRYYPASDITAHLIGMTGRDDNGVEGIELAYDDALRGEPGYRRVLTNRKGELVRDLGVHKEARQGQQMALSIDLRLQYLALRELQKGVESAGARAGTAVLIDVKTGEILAMVNVPVYNPNNPESHKPEEMRNRAMVDVMEPGSTVKPFSALAALSTGRWFPQSYVPIPGRTMRIGRFTIHDVSWARGGLSLTGILQKSSNIGISTVALDIGAPVIRDVMQRVGFGQSTGLSFPGERIGTLPSRERWPEVETATLAYGYGLAITPLQLAQGYAVLGNLGHRVPLTLQRRDAAVQGTQVLDARHVRSLLDMLQEVVEGEGGVFRAKVPGYHVAGKSGTARKNGGRRTLVHDAEGRLIDDGYRYRGLFAGVAPASNPRLALAVVIDEPDKQKGYYGGLVAAPVFSDIMAGALRLLNIAPDNLPPVSGQAAVAPQGGRG